MPSKFPAETATFRARTVSPVWAQMPCTGHTDKRILRGWTFMDGPGVIPDPLYGARFLYEIYTRAEPRYTGRVTVPVLWDKTTKTIVNNESSEIIRMFNSAFDACGATAGDFYPEQHRAEIDALNKRIYSKVNNGVYKAGFATTQEAYEKAFVELFETLDFLEERLGTRRFLIGDRLTEADWRLFTRWYVSTRCMSAISSATCVELRTTRTYRATCTHFIGCLASPRP